MSDDPLDQLSGVYIQAIRWENDMKVPYQKELTFRELHAHMVGEMTLWDSIGKSWRLRNQQANDPGYKPIAPNAGYRRYRRWRG